MEQLNWADWVFVGVISLSGLISLKRGFIKEALSLLTWVAAFIIARTFSDNLQVVLSSQISTPSIRAVIAFALLFLATLIVGAVVNRLISELVKITGLTATDRILGIVFGVGRGIIVSIVAIALMRYTPLPNDPWWSESILIKRFELIEQWSRKTFGEDVGRIMQNI